MKKSLLIASAAILAAGSISAQRLQDGYVTWPASGQLATYVSAWNGGNGTIQIDGVDFDDHNFFISRVKPRTRIQNTDTQIRPELIPTVIKDNGEVTTGTDKRLIYWVPISNEIKGSQRLNALADGMVDGEMFSMWSYIDVWGDWNAPFGWTPGNFADVCHRNGVSVHGVASVPFGVLSSEWSSNLSAITALDADAVGKFLYYHGQDGLGYNSEWSESSGTVTGKLVTMHHGLKEYMKDRNPLWEVMWYGGTWENGSKTFDVGVTENNYPTLFKSSSVFLNYGWNDLADIEKSITFAEGISRDPFYIYAGMNMQGGEPRSGQNYDMLKDYAHSIGLWGAHSTNMLWNDRFNNGGSDLAKQQTYQKAIEQWFGNGPRNPAVQLTPTLNRRHRADDNWAGMSSMMSERSTLDHVIANESFVTFFNLGNGFFFNWRGERQNNLEWHNIGVQDYMPTWRFWFAPEFAQKNVAAGTTKLDAGFVWSDAYMGGSCLKVSGSADKEYLHLFRTAIIPSANNKIVIRYKLLNGEANINLVTSTGKIADGKSALDPGAIKGVVLTVAESADVCDQSYAEGSDGWVTKVFNVSTANARNYTAANGGVGVIALEFTNAKNMELLLGEFGWYPGASGTSVDNITKRTTPQAPVLAKATPLTYANTGADVKMIWNMNHNKAAGEPVYNSDVNTSVFRMYAQQEGFEPVNMGMTTSWAGICYQIPVDGSASSTRVRVGVSAVSEDYLTESPITWSDYMTLPSYQGSDAFVLNKTILKTNEKFTISFVDPLHVSADWKIINSETNTDVWTGSGAEVTCPGLPKVGLYNLEVSFGSTLLTYRNYISVSPDASGAIPEIYTLALNGTDVEEGPEEVTIEVNEPRTFSYTGRDSDGYASQGIEFQSNWVGVNVGELGIQANSSFSVAGWVYYPAFNGSISNFITIEDRTAIWPQSNWGFLWTRINKEGKFLADKIDSAWGCRCDSNADGVRIYYRYDDAQIPEAAWTHVALVFEYNENGEFRQKFYINGVLQKVSIWMKVNKMSVENVVGGSDGRWTALEEVTHLATNWGEDTYEPDYLSSSRPLSSSDWIAFGGRAHEISALEGYIDDFQVWGKAMTQEDVLNSMSGLDASNLPAAVLGFWDFEAAPDADDAFVGKAGANASNAAPKAYHWYQIDDPDHEGRGTKVFDRSASHAGSPQLSGSYKIETLPTWNAGRGATVTGTGTGATGTADIQWAKPGDYAVELTLSNDHGSDTRTYPVVKVEDPSAAIGGVETDADGVVTYVESNTVFVEFAADGDYTVEVYNVAGVMVGHKDVNATAGQNAQITLSNTGIYLVKVVSGGKVMRTVKVLVK